MINMIYLLPTGSDNMRDLPKDKFGVIRTPYGGNAWGIKEGYSWAADNGAFTNGFDPLVYFPWLESMLPWYSTCLFVTYPDVVGNASQTFDLYDRWCENFTDWPTAFVAQDGQEDLPLPVKFDWLFIGGTTEWKMSNAAIECIHRAKQEGKRIHVGRINSLRRIKHFMLEGVDSVDGTHWIYEPDKAKIRIRSWLNHLPLQGW